MSTPTFHWDPDRRRWVVMQPSLNPVYSDSMEGLVELLRLEEIDRSVTEWIDCVDAEAIWQDMKRKVDSEDS